MSRTETLSRFKFEVDPIVARPWVEPKRCVTSHNNLCEICRKTFPNHAGAILNCIYCNVICHVSCMAEFHHRLNPSKEWICFYCIDYLDDSKRTHKMKQENNLCLAKYNEAQVIVSKHWRRYAARKFYVRMYNLIVYMQVRFRVNRRKAAFHRQVQGKFRPFNLRIMRCSNLNLDLFSKKGQLAAARRARKGSGGGGSNSNDPQHHGEGTEEPETNFIYVVVTVVDMGKGSLSQTWRLSTDLVPVRVTLRPVPLTPTCPPSLSHPPPASAAAPSRGIHHDPPSHHHPHHHHSAQTHYYHQPRHLHVDSSFLLGGVSGYQFVVLTVFQRGSCSRDLLLGQTYVDLSQGMLWKRGGSFCKPLEQQDFAVKDHLGMDLKNDCRARPQGSIDFEIQPVQGLCSGCGMVSAPCAEDLVRIVSLQPRFPGFTLPRPVGGTQDRRKHGVGLSGGGTVLGAGGVPSSSLHSKKGWIAIADGKIYLYGHFGDSLKVRINVEHFSFYATIRNKAVVYVLRSADFPDLEFHTINKEDELRWKCAFLSTFRSTQFPAPGGILAGGGADGGAQDGDNSSNSSAADTSRAHHQQQQHYDMRALVRDLALVEVSRYNNREEVLLHFYSPGAAVPTQPVQLLHQAGISVKHHKHGADGIGVRPSLPPLNGSPSANISSPSSVTVTGPSRSVHLPPLAALKGNVSLTSSSSSLTVDGDSVPSGPHAAASGTKANASAPAAAAAASTISPSRLSDKQLVVTSTVAAAAAAAATSKAAMTGLFDEIDREIANIQHEKRAYRRAYREFRTLGRQQAQAQGTLSASVSVPAVPLDQQGITQPQQQQQQRHHPLLPHRRSSLGARQMSQMHRTASTVSRASDLGSTGSGTVPSTQRQPPPPPPPREPAPTLQSVREAVSDMCAAEEGVLNDKLNSVGAAFVAKVLTAIRQKKHVHS